MAERIEGLSIELDLETMKINSGLQDLKSHLTTVNSEMKANMSAFDRSDRSIGKYETRLQGLNKKLEVQQAVTDKAYSSYEKLVKEHGEGSKEAQKAAKEYNNQVASLNNLSRYVERVEDDLSQLREEQRIANSNWTKMGNKLDNAGNKMQAFGNKATGVGNAMSTTITPAVIGMGTAMGLVASSYEDSSVRIQNSLGLTAEETKELTDISRNIYKNGFGESADEIDTALLQTKQNIRDLNNEDLERITEKAFLLADTFEADVNEVTRAGNNLMKGFGLEADEAFDLMAKGAQNGLNFSNEMFDNLSEYSTLFGNMGYSAEEYFELLQKGTDAGVYNLDYINDVMKEFQVRIKDGSKTTSDAMVHLSDSTVEVWKQFEAGDKTVKDVSNSVLKELEGMENQVLANQIGVELFGTKFEDLESDAVYSLGGIGEGLEDVDGTMDDMTKNTERSISRQWKSTWREAKEVLLPVGETLLDFTREVLPDVKDGIEDVTKWFEELDDEGKKNILMFGGIAAAAGPVLSVVGGLSSGIGGLLKVGGSLSTLLGKVGGTALLGKFGALGMAGPVGLAVAGVAGLTYGIYSLSDSMRDNSKVNLEKIETMQSELQATDDLISRFDELQDKNALTTDEMLRYMDILALLQQTNAPDKINELTTEQEGLIEKSGLTNEEMEEFLDLNDDVIEKAPATSKAISSQGEAYAENTLALKEYSQEQRNILEADVQQQLNDAIDEHAQTQRDLNKLIAEAKELDRARMNNQEEQKENMRAQEEQQRLIKGIEQEINDLADSKETKDILQIERLKTTLGIEEDTLREMKNQENSLDSLSKGLTDKYIQNQENLDLTREELAELDNVRFKYEEIILSQLGLNYEKGQGLKAVETQIESLSEEKEKLDELRYSGELNTQEYQDQVDKINTQISKLETAKSELENINEVAGRTIYQSRVVNVKFHARYSGFKTGDSANIGLVGGGGYQRYAEGTKSSAGHPGGHAILGDGIGFNAGSELVSLPGGKMFLSASEPTLYPDLPKGAHVIPASKTKTLLKGINHYAEGTSDWETLANPIDTRTDFMKLLALLGKQNNSPGQTTRTVIDHTKELLNATLQQNEILMQLLAKDSNPILDARSLGRGLEPIITETQNRNKKVRESFAT